MVVITRRGRREVEHEEGYGRRVERHLNEGMVHGFVNPLDHLDAPVDALGTDLQRMFR